jgi:hypothetical protein
VINRRQVLSVFLETYGFTQLPRHLRSPSPRQTKRQRRNGWDLESRGGFGVRIRLIAKESARLRKRTEIEYFLFFPSSLLLIILATLRRC